MCMNPMQNHIVLILPYRTKKRSSSPFERSKSDFTCATARDAKLQIQLLLYSEQATFHAWRPRLSRRHLWLSHQTPGRVSPGHRPTSKVVAVLLMSAGYSLDAFGPKRQQEPAAFACRSAVFAFPFQFKPERSLQPD